MGRTLQIFTYRGNLRENNHNENGDTEVGTLEAISQKGMQEASSKMKHTRAAGPGSIPVELVKLVRAFYRSPLLKLRINA